MSEIPRITTTGINFVAPTFNQLGILVLDGSGSMTLPTAGNIPKAQAVNEAVRGLFTRFRNSRQASNFSFSVVTFDENAQLHTPVTAATVINDDGDYDPLPNHGGGTNIGAGLREAKRVAEDFLRQAPRGVPSSVVLVVMSDGRDGEGGVVDPTESLRIADEIKRNQAITICSTYFEGLGSQDQAAQEHLKLIASNPARGYQTVHDAQSLRDFFITSTSSVAGNSLL